MNEPQSSERIKRLRKKLQHLQHIGNDRMDTADTALEERQNEILSDLSLSINELAEKTNNSVDLVRYIVEQRITDLIGNDEAGKIAMFETTAQLNQPVPTENLLEQAGSHVAHVVFERGTWGSREFAHRRITAADKGPNFEPVISDAEIRNHPTVKTAKERGWKVSQVFHGDNGHSKATEALEHKRALDVRLGKR